MTTVLVAMTLPDTQRFAELAIAAAELGAVPACLSGAGASLTDILDQLVAAGISEIRLVGLTFDTEQRPRLRPTWLGRVARYWLSQHRDDDSAAVCLRLVPTVLHGTAEHLPEDPGRVLLPKSSGLSSPLWQTIPPVRTHLLICRGSRCAARGAAAVTQALTAELADRNMLDDQVLVTLTGCLFPCTAGPVIACYPHGLWFGPVQPADAPVVADLLAGRVDPDRVPLKVIGSLRR